MGVNTFNTLLLFVCFDASRHVSQLKSALFRFTKYYSDFKKHHVSSWMFFCCLFLFPLDVTTYCSLLCFCSVKNCVSAFAAGQEPQPVTLQASIVCLPTQLWTKPLISHLTCPLLPPSLTASPRCPGSLANPLLPTSTTMMHNYLTFCNKLPSWDLKPSVCFFSFRLYRKQTFSHPLQKNTDCFCDCCEQKSSIMQRIFLKMQQKKWFPHHSLLTRLLP